MNIPLMSLEIGMGPNLFEIGSLLVTWHGFFTFIAVALAVFLVGRWAKKDGMVTDAVYSVAVWAIIGGIIGTRAFHVLDLWNDIYRHDPVQIIKIWQGGITIYGGILGGFVGGAAYIKVRNDPRFLSLWNRVFRIAKLEEAPLPSIGRLADLTVPAVLLAMAIGRGGDIINGEHFAKLTDLPWGVAYTHTKTELLYANNGLNSHAASHPAVVYELLWDLVVLGMILPLRSRLRPPGMLFAMYLGAYSVGKFFISFLRLDKEWVIGLTEAHFVAIVVMAITIPLLISKAKLVKPTVQARPQSAAADTKG